MCMTFGKSDWPWPSKKLNIYAIRNYYLFTLKFIKVLIALCLCFSLPLIFFSLDNKSLKDLSVCLSYIQHNRVPGPCRFRGNALTHPAHCTPADPNGSVCMNNLSSLYIITHENCIALEKKNGPSFPCRIHILLCGRFDLSV